MEFVSISLYYFREKYNLPQILIQKIAMPGVPGKGNNLAESEFGSVLSLRKQGGLMDPKLVKQFILFLVILFGWTIVVLLAGPK